MGVLCMHVHRQRCNLWSVCQCQQHASTRNNMHQHGLTSMSNLPQLLPACDTSLSLLQPACRCRFRVVCPTQTANPALPATESQYACVPGAGGLAQAPSKIIHKRLASTHNSHTSLYTSATILITRLCSLFCSALQPYSYKGSTAAQWQYSGSTVVRWLDGWGPEALVCGCRHSAAALH